MSDCVTDWAYEDARGSSSASARYERDLVEAGVGGRANPSASRLYSRFGADFVSLLGIGTPSE